MPLLPLLPLLPAAHALAVEDCLLVPSFGVPGAGMHEVPLDVAPAFVFSGCSVDSVTVELRDAETGLALASRGYTFDGEDVLVALWPEQPLAMDHPWSLVSYHDPAYPDHSVDFMTGVELTVGVQGEPEVAPAAGPASWFGGTLGARIRATAAPDPDGLSLLLVRDPELPGQVLSAAPYSAGEVELFVERLAEVPPAEWCLDVSQRDAAGRETEPQRVCLEVVPEQEGGGGGCGLLRKDETVAMAGLLGLFGGLRRRRTGSPRA